MNVRQPGTVMCPSWYPCAAAPRFLMLEQIQQEVKNDLFYQQNFANDGERFVAWYLRRVLLRDPIATRDDITDGPHDKQIDAVIVDDEDSRIVIIQGKFIGEKGRRRTSEGSPQR